MALFFMMRSGSLGSFGFFDGTRHSFRAGVSETAEHKGLTLPGPISKISLLLSYMTLLSPPRPTVNISIAFIRVL